MAFQFVTWSLALGFLCLAANAGAKGHMSRNVITGEVNPPEHHSQKQGHASTVSVTKQRKVVERRKRQKRKNNVDNEAVVCWNGPGMTWGGKPITYPVGNSFDQGQQQTGTWQHITIFGEGCLHCTVGQLCTFTISFASDFYFDSERRFPELMVIMSGPSITTAEVSTLNQAGIHFLVKYRIWDKGVYKCTVKIDCSLDDKGSELSVAEFELMVENPSQNFPLSNLVSSPCQLGHYGRWKSENNFEGNNEEVDFKFEEFGCSGPLTPFSEFATKMNSKNIFEISFVGDEHLRNSFFHLQFLLSGKIEGALNEDVSWNFYQNKTKSRLKMNFYWLDGSYEDGYFGCHYRGKLSGRISDFPEISESTDVIIINDGQWTFRNCKQPEQAFSYFLPKVLNWLKDLGENRRKIRILWKNISPSPVVSLGTCGGPTNSEILWANQITRDVLEEFGVEYLDLWGVESAAYDHSCFSSNDNFGLGEWQQDFTYSCIFHNFSKAYGPIGEVVVRWILHHLAIS